MIKISEYENYSDNEPVGFAVIKKDDLPGPINVKNWEYIPQTIFHRLICIGDAYNMHFSEIIDHVVDTVLNTDQCDDFKNELIDISKKINDTELEIVIKRIITLINATNGTSGLVLIISPP